MSDQNLRAADVLAQRLYAAGCRFAFGMPGGEVLTLVDALERAGLEPLENDEGLSGIGLFMGVDRRRR